MANVREDWDYFYARRADADAAIIVNLGLLEISPDPERQWRLTVRLKIDAPTAKGMVKL